MKTFVSDFRAGAYAFAFTALWVSSARSADDVSEWERHTIDASDKTAGKLGADGVRLGFANADDDPDVVTGWENGDAIRVALNPGPENAKALWPAFTVGRVRGAEDAVFADLDANGVLDVVSCTEGKTRTVFVHWAPESVGDYDKGEAWTTEAIPSLEGAQMWMYCLPFDANGDGREDLILGAKNEAATVGWLEQPAENPRDLVKWTYHELYEAGWIMSIRANDLDGDGDEDVVFSDRKGPSTGVWWLENVGKVAGRVGSVFGEPKLLGASGDEVMFLDIADVNRDGRRDVIAAVRERDVVVLVQPGDSASPWTEKRASFPAKTAAFSTGTAKAVGWFPGDSEDSPWRFLLTCERANGNAHGVFVLEPETGSEFGDGSPLSLRPVSGPVGVKFDRMELLDLDGDGDLDLMTCEERDNLGVFWYENPGD